MTDARCEPPEALRGVDWWHWVQWPEGPAQLLRWRYVRKIGAFGWTLNKHSTTTDNATKAGWRYLSPAASDAEVTALYALVDALRAERDAAVAEVARLRPLLEECANDLAMEIDSRYPNAGQHPGEAKRRDRDMEIVNLARAALEPQP